MCFGNLFDLPYATSFIMISYLGHRTQAPYMQMNSELEVALAYLALIDLSPDTSLSCLLQS